MLKINRFTKYDRALNTIISILTKTIVRSFYKEFAVVFLIGLYICFGFLRSDDHIFLAKFLLATDGMVVFYFIIWSLYNVFIISYFSKFFTEKAHLFLFDLLLISSFKRNLSLFVLFLNLFAPVLVYALFVIGIAWSIGAYNPIIFIGFFLMISTIVAIFFFNKVIAKPDISLTKTQLFKLNFKFKKPPFSFFFFQLFEKEWLKLLITKGLSVFLLLALSQILQTDNDDIRPLLVVVLMGFLPNFSLVTSYHEFENQTMFYFKNLPISISSRWVTAFSSIGLILLPELFLLYRYAWSNLPWYAPLFGYVFGLSLATIYYSALYLKIAATERFSNLIFIAAILCFIAILFKISVLVISIGLLVVAYISLVRLYFNYEFILKSDD